MADLRLQRQKNNMAQAYILTEEGRAYTQEGVNYVLDQIINVFNDHTDVELVQGRLYNKPDILAKLLSKDPKHSYVFVSHAGGLEILYDSDDINRFVNLLDSTTDKDETSWSIIMKALGLL